MTVDKERLQILSTLAVTVLLIGFAALMVTVVPGPGADTLGATIITAVVTKWLTQGAQQQAEKTAEKLQEAVQTVTNGAATAEAVNVKTEDVTVTKEQP